MAKRPHKRIAMGGTFDHFHAGHAHFIEFASKIGDELVIGVTTMEMTKHKEWASLIEPVGLRKKQIKRFCDKLGITYSFADLYDPYGPTISREPGDRFDGLCVTEETIEGAKKINEFRERVGLRPLKTFVCNMLLGENKQVVSSSQIRAGATNRLGKRYLDLWEPQAGHWLDLELTSKQRQFFHGSPGKIVDEPTLTFKPRPPITAVVGDTSLARFLHAEWEFDLGVFDLQQQRQPVTDEVILQLEPDLTVTNPAGFLTAEMVQTLQQSLTKKLHYVKVEGEEDLATTALILLLPLYSVIYYGQPDQGLIELVVTEKLKEEVFWVLFDSTV